LLPPTVPIVLSSVPSAFVEDRASASSTTTSLPTWAALNT
jgi:hypothetical protein